MRAAGFVLAGGKSSRMKRDKALLPRNGRFLVEEVASKVRTAAGTAILIGDPSRYPHLNLECIPDVRPGLGPLAGIETALASARADFNLIVSCDIPDIEISWLSALLDYALRENSLCVVTRDASGSVHPLCGVYQTNCIPEVRKRLDENRLKLMDFIREIRADILDTTQVISNINTPQEWSGWQEEYLAARTDP